MKMDNETKDQSSGRKNSYAFALTEGEYELLKYIAHKNNLSLPRMIARWINEDAKRLCP